MPNIGIVLLVIAAIAVGLWLASRLEKAYMRRKSGKARVAEEHPVSRRIESIPTKAPSPVMEDPADRLADRLRERKANGTNLAAAVTSVTVEFGDRVTTDSVIRMAIKVGYRPNEVAVFMAQRYQPAEIADILAEEGDFGVEELADAIMPVVDGETELLRAERTFEIVKSALQIDDDNEELLQLPGHHGCSGDEAAAIVYNNTDLCLASVLKDLKLFASPDVAARISKNFGVDLSDEDEYKTLREDDGVEFGAAVLMLKACGKDAETIIAAEHAYEEFSGDQLDEVFSSLSVAGFTNEEIMIGIARADVIDDNSWAAIIRGALESKVPMEDIASVLHEEDLDPDDLDTEMRELEFEVLTRVDVLHALLHFKGKSAVQAEAANIESNQQQIQ